MKYVWIICIIFGLSHFSIAQNDIISVSKSGFYYYDGYPFKIADPVIPLNIGYERIFSNNYGLKLHYVHINDLYYLNRNESQHMSLRSFSSLALSLKRYYNVSGQLVLYPMTRLVLRSASESWKVYYPPMRPHRDNYFHDKIGLGVGGGIQYRLFDRIMIETEVSHTEYLYTISTDHDYVAEENNVGNTGSDHELRVSLSVGYMF